MKNQRTTFLGFPFIVILLALCFVGCKEKEVSNDITSQVIEKHEGTAKDSVLISIEFPQCENKQLCTAIVESLNEKLGGSYDGDYLDYEAFINHYLNNYLNELKQNRGEWDAESEYSKELKVTKRYETDKLVTYEVSTYDYMGGAHGFGLFYGITFRKSDGRTMGMNVLNSQYGDEVWNTYIKDGLMEYFEVSTESELGEYLLDTETYMIPMPQFEPYFSENGLEFIYQMILMKQITQTALPCILQKQLRLNQIVWALQLSLQLEQQQVHTKQLHQ